MTYPALPHAASARAGGIFNDFAIEQEIDARGFTALYQNFLETQVATVGLRVRF